MLAMCHVLLALAVLLAAALVPRTATSNPIIHTFRRIQQQQQSHSLQPEAGPHPAAHHAPTVVDDVEGADIVHSLIESRVPHHLTPGVVNAAIPTVAVGPATYNGVAISDDWQNGITLPCARVHASVTITGGLQCTPATQTFMNNAITTIFTTASIVTNVSPGRKVDQCLAAANHDPRFDGEIRQSMPFIHDGLNKRIICARLLPIAPREVERKCGDAMAQNICRCATIIVETGVIGVDFTPEQFRAARITTSLGCSDHIPTDTEMLTQRVPCINPNRNDPVVGDVPVLSARTGISDCPILPGKTFHPLPVEWLHVLGRPRYEYTVADLVPVPGGLGNTAAMAALITAPHVMMHLNTGINGIVTGTGFTVVSATHVSLLVDRTANVIEDRAVWNNIIPAPLIGQFPITNILKAYPMISITCQQLVDRYGTVRVDQCTPLYHATNAKVYFENSATYAPLPSSWYAFDWFYSANFGAMNKATRLFEFNVIGNHDFLDLGWFPNYDAMMNGRRKWLRMMSPERDNNLRTEYQELVLFSSVKDLKHAYRVQAFPPNKWYDMVKMGQCHALFQGYVGNDYFQGRELAFSRPLTPEGAFADLPVGHGDEAAVQLTGRIWHLDEDHKGRLIARPNPVGAAGTCQRENAFANACRQHAAPLACPMIEAYVENPNLIRSNLGPLFQSSPKALSLADPPAWVPPTRQQVIDFAIKAKLIQIPDVIW